jgi:IMP dehydrogenase
MINKSSLDPIGYNDILLLPQYSEITSRDDVNLNLEGKDYKLIFSAPMKNIAEPSLIVELDRLGGVGILHRFFDSDKQRYDAVAEISVDCNNFGVAIGINDFEEELDFAWFSVHRGANFVVVDTASGYLQITLDAVRKLYDFREDKKLDFQIIAGNVVDVVGCMNLIENGTDIIRVNIGTGLQCLTSRSIGIGCPPLTAIANCAQIKSRYPNVTLLADGGIYTPGDALKALCFGADGVMIGSLFGRAEESENNGIIYGMSSYLLQERMNKAKKSNEGTVTIIPKEEIRPLAEIFGEFTYGLKSGLSYLGCDDINKLHDMNIEYIYNGKGK